MVEAAGVEPDHPPLANRLMVRDFRSNQLTTRCLLPRIESPGVPYSPLESTPVLAIFWRRPRYAERRDLSSTGLKSTEKEAAGQ
jgi:hypothetical protein